MTGWISAMYSNVDIGKTAEALDIMFDAIDDACLAGSFDLVDSWLREIDVRLLSAALIVGLLTMSWHAKERVPYRFTFAAAAKDRLVELVGPERAENLTRSR